MNNPILKGIGGDKQISVLLMRLLNSHVKTQSGYY